MQSLKLMKFKDIVWMAVLVFCIAACGGNDYSPKPKAYLRIDMPEHSYWRVDTLPVADDYVVVLPFTFEANQETEITLKRPRLVATVTSGGAVRHERLGCDKFDEVWLDVNYPQWSGVVFLTYKRINDANDLRGQTDTSLRLLEKHYKVASGVQERVYEDPLNGVYGTAYHLRGNKVASTYQFWATDSSKHFLRGALMLDRSPNNDSLAPVLDYIQADIDHLMETLRWRN